MDDTHQTSPWIRRILTHNYFPIGLLLLLNILVGIWVFADYGESWDEQLRFQYGERSLAAYTGAGKSLIDEKGAFYVMLARLGSDAIRFINNRYHPIEAWHLIHFLTFLMGVFFLYKICLKMYGKWTAFGTALLFNTQPLLWGHAFINPKDIPFMSFFLGSVALGMDMVDGYAKTTDPFSRWKTGIWEELPRTISQEWSLVSPKRRAISLILVGIACGILIALLFLSSIFQGFIADTIRSVYEPSTSNLLGKLFARLAENRAAIPVEFYIQKAIASYARLIWLYLGSLGLFLATLVIRTFPVASGSLYQFLIRPALSEVGRSLVSPNVITAGIFLGLSTAIRVLGPASGVLVSIYFFLKARWRAIPVLTAYALIAMMALYLTWPYLWGSPVRNFIHSLTIASDYPWEGKVLFNGVEYPVSAAPRSYLPVLMVLQTPEITLLLFLLGLVTTCVGILRGKTEWGKPLIAALWLFTPVLMAVILNPTMYDNFRQFLFIIPAAFIFVGAGIHLVINRIRSRWVILLILIALVLPNILSLINLHPYQYTYYNNLTGGLKGAFRAYETDYWATSYREATEFLNQNAPKDSTILVVGPSHIVEHYARQDLQIIDYSAKNPEKISGPFFALISSRFDKDLSLYPDALQVFSTGKDGAIFSVIKHVQP